MRSIITASPVDDGSAVDARDQGRELLENRLVMRNIYQQLDSESRRSFALASNGMRDQVIEAAFGYLPADAKSLATVKAVCGPEILGTVFLAGQPLPYSVDLICAGVLLKHSSRGKLPFLRHMSIEQEEPDDGDGAIGKYAEKFSYRLQEALKSEHCRIETLEIQSQLPKRYFEVIFSALTLYPDKVRALEIQETTFGKQTLAKFAQYLSNPQSSLRDLSLEQVRLPPSHDHMQEFFESIGRSNLQSLDLDLLPFEKKTKFHVDFSHITNGQLKRLSLNSVLVGLAGPEAADLGRLVASNDELGRLTIDW